MPITDSQGSSAATFKVNTLQCGSTVIRNGISYYDQQSIPSSPNIGDVWRERDLNKNIIQNWIWSGIYWISIQQFVFYIANGDIAYSTPIINTYSQIYAELFTFTTVSSGAGNNNASNYRTHQLKFVNSTGSEITIASISTQTLLNNCQKTYTVSINNFYSTATYQSFLIRYVNTGSPKEVGSGSGLLRARFAR